MSLTDTLALLDLPLFSIGGTLVTLSSLLSFVLALLLLFTFARWIRDRLLRRLLARTPLDLSTRQTIGTLVHYAIVVLGFIAVMQTAGINLSSLTLVGGAVGVGIGFGLQNIVSNFISGLIVMFERPVKLGDRIEVGGFEGDVISINARTTTLRTARGAVVIVPNQKFITEFVRNWDVSLPGGSATSVIVPVKVAREHDPQAVEPLLRQAARLDDDRILREPPPAVYLVSVDAAGYAFELQVWLRAEPEQRALLQTRLLDRVHARLKQTQVKLV